MQRIFLQQAAGMVQGSRVIAPIFSHFCHCFQGSQVSLAQVLPFWNDPVFIAIWQQIALVLGHCRFQVRAGWAVTWNKRK